MDELNKENTMQRESPEQILKRSQQFYGVVLAEAFQRRKLKQENMMKLASYEFVKDVNPRKVEDGVEYFKLAHMDKGITAELNRSKKNLDLILFPSTELDNCIIQFGGEEDFRRDFAGDIQRALPRSYNFRLIKREY